MHDHIPDQDTRILRRLQPYIDVAVDRQPEPHREILHRHLDEHRGLQLDLERRGDPEDWHIVVGAAGLELCAVPAVEVGFRVDNDGASIYVPDEILDDDLAVDGDPSGWFE